MLGCQQSCSLAEIYAGLGEVGKCLDWLEKAVEERETLTATYTNYPWCNPLRSHPRYHALMRKMNLEP